MIEGRIVDFLFLLILFGLLLISLKKIIIFPLPRRFPALDALDEIVGRAVETGRPVFSDPGRWGGFTNAQGASQGFAGLGVIRYLAQKSAETNAELVVFTQNVGALPLIEETLREPYLDYPDSREPDVRFIPGVSGNSYNTTVVASLERERGAAYVSVGPLRTSAGILAEGAARAKSMTIMGTTYMDALAFLAVACDYVIIGEEIFAAGSILGGDEDMQRSIASQDIFKLLLILIILLGSIITLSGNWLIDLLMM